ncbi:MAG: rod shape-determining protein MreC [Deltaproteobacteria bacterium]|nr:rod shape-determining protein MreC [Deltaproteobacteria bacterium]
MWRDLLTRYRQTLLLIVALVAPVASMYFHGKARKETSVIERGLLAVTSPVTRVSHDVVAGVGDLLSAYVVLTLVEERNRELERENKILLGEALRSRTQAAELARIKQLCGFRERAKEFETVPARVVGRDVSQFFQVVRLRLDVEGAAGVREGQAVITHDGVVGRIEKLSGNWADVMLVTDARSQVHATVPGKGVVGSVRGRGKRNEFSAQFVHLDDAERGMPLGVGDAVYTTGHDRVFPAGLEIGHIAEGAPTRSGPYYEFVLAPAVSYATLEEVLVVVNYRGAMGESEGKPAAEPSKPSGRRTIDPANTPDAPP